MEGCKINVCVLRGGEGVGEGRLVGWGGVGGLSPVTRP